MEKFDLENFPTSDSARKMLGYVSDGFYDESYVGKWMYQVMGIEYDKALEIVADLPAQFYPETATWGLMYHEIKWGLPVRLNLSYEERRSLIYQKRDYRAPMTPYRMEQYLEDATGFEVHIADMHDPGEYGFVPSHPNVFKAYFIGEGTLDIRIVFEMLNWLKQSHTTYKINDRMEMLLDNSRMEKIFLKRIKLAIGINFFWRWLLDGSVTADQILTGRFAGRLRCRMAVLHRQACRAGEKTLIRLASNGWHAVKIKQNAAIRFFGRPGFSGKTNACFRSGIHAEESASVGDVLVKTRDHWFLDGMISMNGSRNLDSVYKKEDIDEQ